MNTDAPAAGATAAAPVAAASAAASAAAKVATTAPAVVKTVAAAEAAGEAAAGAAAAAPAAGASVFISFQFGFNFALISFSFRFHFVFCFVLLCGHIFFVNRQSRSPGRSRSMSPGFRFGRTSVSGCLLFGRKADRPTKTNIKKIKAKKKGKQNKTKNEMKTK